MRLAIVTCMDSRLDLIGALGLEMGCAHILRNAGGRVTADVVRSIAISIHIFGVREIGIVHHTGCGLEGASNADFASRTGLPNMDFLPFCSVAESLTNDVNVLLGAGVLPPETIVWGAVYKTETGSIELVQVPAPHVE